MQELGQELGLKGYVRNEKDGTVTVFVQGEENQVELFIEKLKAPPPPRSSGRSSESQNPNSGSSKSGTTG